MGHQRLHSCHPCIRNGVGLREVANLQVQSVAAGSIQCVSHCQAALPVRRHCDFAEAAAAGRASISLGSCHDLSLVPQRVPGAPAHMQSRCVYWCCTRRNCINATQVCTHGPCAPIAHSGKWPSTRSAPADNTGVTSSASPTMNCLCLAVGGQSGQRLPQSCRQARE